MTPSLPPFPPLVPPVLPVPTDPFTAGCIATAAIANAFIAFHTGLTPKQREQWNDRLFANEDRGLVFVLGLIKLFNPELAQKLAEIGDRVVGEKK